jgi:hypothetical protein
MIKHVPFRACGAMNHSFGAKNRNQITLPSRTDESYAIKQCTATRFSLKRMKSLREVIK